MMREGTHRSGIKDFVFPILNSVQGFGGPRKWRGIHASHGRPGSFKVPFPNNSITCYPHLESQQFKRMKDKPEPIHADFK